MQVYWLEQTQEDLVEETDWLSAREINFLNGLRFAKRRADWRLGRWTAKRALASCLNLPHSLPALANIEVRPAPSGAPELFFEDKLAPLTISLSHRNNRAVCFIAPPAVALGCDLELIEPHSAAFIADYFTSNEQALVMRQSLADRPLLLALLWSAKESALKALRMGLRLDTRCVTVEARGLSVAPDRWNPLNVRYNTRIFNGWWQIADDMVRTVVAAPPSDSPVRLAVGTHFRERSHQGIAQGRAEERVLTTEA